MKKLILFFVIGALGACGKLPDPTPVPQTPVAEDRNPFFTQQAPAQVAPASAPVVYQQAPAPQAAQTDSGPGWGAVLAGAAAGYILGSSNKPAVAPAPATRPVVVYRDVPRPAQKPIVPLTPPRPNTIPAVQPPKPTVAPTTPYVVTQNTPKTTSVPTAPRTTTSTPYRSTWSSPVRSTPSFRR